jgi:hypothetical protein
MTIGLLVLALMAANTSPVCAPPPGTKGVVPMFFLDRIPSATRDSIVTVRLCLAPPQSGVGSYNVTLTYDSTTMVARRVDVASGGLQVANANAPGTIRIAGASPSGFRTGLLATIAFRPRSGQALGKIRVALNEVNAPSGTSVMAGARVAGYPSSDRTLGVIEVAPRGASVTGRTANPRIDSISPRSAKLDNEGVVDIVIYGGGFGVTNNVVLFDAATVTGVSSESAGTVIRFTAPGYIPAHGGAQGHRVTPGRYDIRVRTPIGTSNAVTFTARDGER